MQISNDEQATVLHGLRKVGEVGMMNIVQFNTLDVILIFVDIALILIRLHMLEKRVKELEGR